MKTIIENTAKVITGMTILFIYSAVTQLLVEVAKDVDSVASAVVFALLTSFVIFLCYVATALYIGTIRSKN